MKLKKLSIHNLASIEDAVVDFDSKALKDEPLFQLCGETGSGKTLVFRGNDGLEYEAKWGAESYKKMMTNGAVKDKLNPVSEYREWKCLASGVTTAFAKSDGMPGKKGADVKPQRIRTHIEVRRDGQGPSTVLVAVNERGEKGEVA